MRVKRSHTSTSTVLVVASRTAEIFWVSHAVKVAIATAVVGRPIVARPICIESATSKILSSLYENNLLRRFVA